MSSDFPPNGGLRGKFFGKSGAGIRDLCPLGPFVSRTFGRLICSYTGPRLEGDGVSVGNVAESTPGCVVHRLTEEPGRPVSKHEIRAARMHALKHPGVRPARQRIAGKVHGAFLGHATPNHCILAGSPSRLQLRLESRLQCRQGPLHLDAMKPRLDGSILVPQR